MTKKIISLFLIIGLLLSFTACGEKSDIKQPRFDKKATASKYAELPVIENEKYRLEITKSDYGIVLTELSTGLKWTSSPVRTAEDGFDEMGMPLKRHNMLDSAITVNYRDTVSDVNKVAYSYIGAVKDGRVICKEKNNGITIEYYFDNIEIMIPVDYVLCDDYVSVSVNPKLIQEEKNIVTAVTLAPFLCSAKNDTENAYLFVPSGSGAIASVDTVSREGLSYSAQVYGNDLNMERLYLPNTTKDIKLPVYGAKNGDTAVLAVIDKASDSALINAIVGGNVYGHSAVYSSFQLRGYTDHQAKSFSATVNNRIFADEMILDTLSVRFYPLSGENADYNGMAKKYRDYLIKSKELKNEKNEAVPINLTFIGGAEISKSFLGVPYKTVYPTTSISDVQDILTDVSKNIEAGLSVNLKGFGSTGSDVGEPAGGYCISSKIGTVKELKELSELCENNKHSLYMDFDILRYNSSSNGFSIFFDSVMTSGNQKNYSYYYDKAVKDELKEYKYKLLLPSKFKEAAEKLTKKTEGWGLTGISLSTASNLSYSDYSSPETRKYFAKSGFGEEVKAAIKQIRGNKFNFCASDANVYAAVNADIIVDAPLTSSGEYAFEKDIPFYQMVFGGYIPMTGESINLSANPDKAFLKTVEAGCGLNYTVISSWDNSIVNSVHPYFYGSLYSDVKDKLITQYKSLKEYYEKISGAAISSHRVIDATLRETVFDNGVTVYVNYGSEKRLTPAGEVEAENFLVLEKPI